MVRISNLVIMRGKAVSRWWTNIETVTLVQSSHIGAIATVRDSGLLLGLMCRVQSSGDLGKHDRMTQGDDGSFFLSHIESLSKSWVGCTWSESHDHRLYLLPIAASAGVRHVLCTAQGKILELHVQFFKRFARLHHLSTRHWLMRHLSAVHAKSMAFGASTQDLHSEPFCDTSTVETAAARPDSAVQNTFTTNKTHISDITRCSAEQHKACPSEHLPARLPGLSLALLETCDQPLRERYCSVSQPWSLTLARSNLSTTGPYNPAMPTKSSFQHAKV